MLLVKPSLEHLPGYVDALERGWSPNTERPVDAIAEELDEIRERPETFWTKLDDPEAKGPPIRLPDGSLVARLPGFIRWMWDGEFAGSIGFRWAPGTTALPPTCLGHVGYSVVPWKQRRGYATAALAHMISEARISHLPYVELTTDVENLGSQRVILANGGVFVEQFDKGPAYGGVDGLRYRITL